MEAMVIRLCMYLVENLTIESFHAWIEKSDWSFFIGNVEHSCLSFTKVRSIQDKALICTNCHDLQIHHIL